MDSAFEEPRYLGYLEGHRDWVTCIRTPFPSYGSSNDIILSSSRDKTAMVWKMESPDCEGGRIGYAVRCLTGHSRAIQDATLTSNNRVAITASWDSTLRLWDMELGCTLRTFKEHTSDVNSVAITPDCRQIASGSNDMTIKIRDLVGQCRNNLVKSQHTDWVSCTEFSPLHNKKLLVSGGWDKLVKVWDVESEVLKSNLVGHTGAVYTVTISPDGSLCASGGKDGVAMLWDVNESRHLYSIPAQSPINSLCFSPSHYWLCAATDNSVKIWNLEDDKNVIVNLEKPKTSTYDTEGNLIKSKRPLKTSGIPWCVSLAWSADGRILYVGSTDGNIYVYEFAKE